MRGECGTLTPGLAEASRALRSRPGFALLESGTALPGSISLVASDPDLIMDGDLSDWPRLESELARRAKPTADLGLPAGAAIGWLGFDGRFRFGFYDRPHVFLHDSGNWHGPTPEGMGRDFETDFPRIPFRPQVKKEAFLHAVEKAQAYIAAGDIYQVCLAHPFVADFTGDAWPYFEALRHYSPAPYSAFLNLGDQQVVSSSPECFLRLSGRRVTTRPIKGTRPRRADQQLDQRHAFDLLTSPKEVAELVMITDLERNDLGRVCEYGSVSVPELLKLESYEQVHHLVSTVTGTLRSDVTHAAALRACFPGGSISGAPKKRALEIIAELEPHPRDLYTGAIGYFGYNGESQFSIAIRTAIFREGRASFHVGAGIVADSIPEKEWQETLDKAAGLLIAAGQPTRS
jgi:para-aminobenzoate synthetase component I